VYYLYTDVSVARRILYRISMTWHSMRLLFKCSSFLFHC